MERYHLLVLLFVAFPSLSSANNCCGQSPTNFPFLNQQQTLAVGLNYGRVSAQGRIYDSPLFYSWDNSKLERNLLGVSLASALTMKTQVFVSTSWIETSSKDSRYLQTSQDLSDTLAGLSFEVLSEYAYSPWKPTIALSVIFNVPTGRSVYDSDGMNEAGDVTGHNQWGTGMGLTIRKVYYPIALMAQFKSLILEPTEFEALRISSFWDLSASLFGSYTTDLFDLIINTGLTYNRLTPRRISTSEIQSNIIERTSVLLGLQRPLNDTLSLGITYTDQSWIGRSRNTILNKSINVFVNINHF